MNREGINQLAHSIIDAAYTVHRMMGPGLLESVYEHCLAYELQLRQIPVKRQVSIPLIYRGVTISKEYVIDLLVADAVILELKAVEALLPIHQAQLISYLKLADKRLGFLLNFNVPVMKDGIRRVVNNF